MKRAVTLFSCWKAILLHILCCSPLWWEVGRTIQALLPQAVSCLEKDRKEGQVNVTAADSGCHITACSTVRTGLACGYCLLTGKEEVTCVSQLQTSLII